MIKSLEIRDPDSCLNKAKDGELIFVLLERDAAAPVAVRAWVEERVRLGINRRNDPQILNAEHWIRHAGK